MQRGGREVVYIPVAEIDAGRLLSLRSRDLLEEYVALFPDSGREVSPQLFELHWHGTDGMTPPVRVVYLWLDALDLVVFLSFFRSDEEPPLATPEDKHRAVELIRAVGRSVIRLLAAKEVRDMIHDGGWFG